MELMPKFNQGKAIRKLLSNLAMEPYTLVLNTFACILAPKVFPSFRTRGLTTVDAAGGTLTPTALVCFLLIFKCTQCFYLS